MPQDLGEGTFPEFVMKCARAFGPLRDVGDNDPIPDEFPPDNCHLNFLEDAKKRLAEVKNWSKAQKEKEAKKAFDAEVRSRKRQSEKKELLGENHIYMLKQTARWVLPSKDYEGLKSFMIEQLAESLRGCLHTPAMPRRLSGEQFWAQRIKELRREIADHTEKHNAEVQSARERGEWVHNLLNNLNGTNAK